MTEDPMLASLLEKISPLELAKIVTREEAERLSSLSWALIRLGCKIKRRRAQLEQTQMKMIV